MNKGQHSGLLITPTILLLALFRFTFTNGCEFQYVREPPSTLDCNPLTAEGISFDWTLRIKCTAIANELFTIKWYHNNTNGVIRELGQGDKSVSTSQNSDDDDLAVDSIITIEPHADFVAFSAIEAFTLFGGEYWCQIEPEDSLQQLKPSNKLNIDPEKRSIFSEYPECTRTPLSQDTNRCAEISSTSTLLYASTPTTYTRTFSTVITTTNTAINSQYNTQSTHITPSTHSTHSTHSTPSSPNTSSKHSTHTPIYTKTTSDGKSASAIQPSVTSTLAGISTNVQTLQGSNIQTLQGSNTADESEGESIWEDMTIRYKIMIILLAAGIVILKIMFICAIIFIVACIKRSHKRGKINLAAIQFENSTNKTENNTVTDTSFHITSTPTPPPVASEDTYCTILPACTDDLKNTDNTIQDNGPQIMGNEGLHKHIPNIINSASETHQSIGAINSVAITPATTTTNDCYQPLQKSTTNYLSIYTIADNCSIKSGSDLVPEPKITRSATAVPKKPQEPDMLADQSMLSPNYTELTSHEYLTLELPPTHCPMATPLAARNSNYQSLILDTVNYTNIYDTLEKGQNNPPSSPHPPTQR